MIQDLRKRIKRVQKNLTHIGDKIGEVVESRKDVILSLNRDQMLLGRDAEGKVLTPSYIDDPYFKTKRHADMYRHMKYKLESEHRARIEHPSLYPDKDKNTPNLIVTGVFQSGMFINVGSGTFTIGSTYKDSNDIESKYRGLVFGLSPESKEYFYNHYLKERLKTLIFRK